MLCPSAYPDMAGAKVFGVVAEYVRYLAKPEPVTPELLALSGPVTPLEVFRIAAPCIECGHFAGGVCRLGARVVRILPAVADALPDCAIRPECRWFHEQGRDVCLRCPQVITLNCAPQPAMVATA